MAQESGGGWWGRIFPQSLLSYPGIPSLPWGIQRKVVSYILRRYVGKFIRGEAFKEEDVDVSGGKIEICDLNVDESVRNFG